MQKINSKKIFFPRTSRKNWPKPRKVRKITQYAKEGRFIEIVFSNQKYPWGLYEQSGHVGAGIVLAKTTSGTHIAVVRQWRPTDKNYLGLPSGNIGTEPEKMLAAFLKELEEEIGPIKILSVRICPGFSHNSSRETVPVGGPKCLFPFVVKIKIPTTPKKFISGDEKTFSDWKTIPQIRTLVQKKKISDIISCFSLLAAGIIKSEDFGWKNIKIQN